LTEEKKAECPTLPENWKVEYEQLSEDYRFFVKMGWQATVAVLAVDGLVLGSAITMKKPVVLFALFSIAGILTILMGLETNKWRIRNDSRIDRLKWYDRKWTHFQRFCREEKGSLTWPVGTALAILMILVGIGMFSYACYVVASCLLRCHFII